MRLKFIVSRFMLFFSITFIQMFLTVLLTKIFTQNEVLLCCLTLLPLIILHKAINIDLVMNYEGFLLKAPQPAIYFFVFATLIIGSIWFVIPVAYFVLPGLYFIWLSVRDYKYSFNKGIV